MIKALLFCVLLLAGLYGVRYWFEQNPGFDSELVLTIQDGAQTLQDHLQSAEFRQKVMEKLDETRDGVQNEAAEQWAALKKLAEDGLIQFKQKDSKALRQVVDAVTKTVRAEGESITIDEGRLNPPPANWMVATVANLILAAWVTLGILVFWGLARLLLRNRQGEK